VQPYFVLGGFIPEGAAAFPAEPDYAAASAVVLTFVVDNYDRATGGAPAEIALSKAKAWEASFIRFMQQWVQVC